MVGSAEDSIGSLSKGFPLRNIRMGTPCRVESEPQPDWFPPPRTLASGEVGAVRQGRWWRSPSCTAWFQVVPLVGRGLGNGVIPPSV